MKSIPEGHSSPYHLLKIYQDAFLKEKDGNMQHSAGLRAVVQDANESQSIVIEQRMDALNYLLPLARSYIDDSKRKSIHGIYDVEKKVNKIATLVANKKE